MHYDVIIVGAGSMGMVAGYFLAKSGKRTLLVDSFNPPHDKGSHHGDTRIIRYAYGEGEEYVPLALKAKELWDDLAKETDRDIFLQTGVLNVGVAESEFIKSVLSSAEKFALPVEVMDSAEVNQKWPGMSLPTDMMGCFESTSGVLKCGECIEAYRELAELHGATIVMNSRVKDIEIHDDSVTIKTDEHTFTGNSLVISAGAWAGNLLSMVDLELPLAPVRKTFAWFEADDMLYGQQDYPAFSFETPQGFYYGFPSIDSVGLKVGRHDGGETISPDDPRRTFGEDDKGDLLNFLQQYMPQHGQFKYGEPCMYTLTPDKDFIIDLHPNYSHVAIAAGFSGHGFKFSSVVGQILSDLITEGKCELDISPFRIERFIKR